MKQMLDLLKEWLQTSDDGPCWFDHGRCQAHFLEEKENCLVKRTRQFISGVGILKIPENITDEDFEKFKKYWDEEVMKNQKEYKLLPPNLDMTPKDSSDETPKKMLERIMRFTGLTKAELQNLVRED